MSKKWRIGMYKLSDIISSPVISLYESEFQGIIYNAMFDSKQKKCKYLCVRKEEDGIQRLLKANDIFLVGSECLFIKNSTKLELQCNFDNEIITCFNPLNLPVYNMNGKLLGTSTDVIVDKKLNIIAIELNNGESISSQNICNLGKNIILTNEKHVNISRFKPQNIKILNKTDKENKVIILSPTKQTIQQNKTVEKIVTDFKFLVGRTISQDVLASNGEIIAKNGTTLTKDIIKKASLYGKLVEITRYSKKTNQ